MAHVSACKAYTVLQYRDLPMLSRRCSLQVSNMPGSSDESVLLFAMVGLEQQRQACPQQEVWDRRTRWLRLAPKIAVLQADHAHFRYIRSLPRGRTHMPVLHKQAAYSEERLNLGGSESKVLSPSRLIIAVQQSQKHALHITIAKSRLRSLKLLARGPLGLTGCGSRPLWYVHEQSRRWPHDCPGVQSSELGWNRARSRKMTCSSWQHGNQHNT